MCYEGSILSCKFIKIHPVLLADEFSISKHAKRNFYENMDKTSFLKLVIVVIWSVDAYIFFLSVFLLKKSLGFVFKEILITQT